MHLDLGLIQPKDFVHQYLGWVENHYRIKPNCCV